MTTGVIIVAAGRGTRLQGAGPKQYRLLAGKSVLARTLTCFLDTPGITAIQVVIHKDDESEYEHAIAGLIGKDARLRPPVFGGETRQQSVHAGLLALTDMENIMVHDAARPFVSEELLARALAATDWGEAAIPGVAVTDTIKQVDDNQTVIATPPRESLRAIQTPQVFTHAALLEAHQRAAQENRTTFTDDGALMEWAGHRVLVFQGDPANIKLTYEADFITAEQKFIKEGRTMISRTGIGYDVHAMSEGDHVWLGGLKIPNSQGVTAHSDGDVVLHALTDAVLGALADGDIGTHFPPSDPQWRGASSDRFLAFACEKVRARGGIIDHLDCALLCEAPRLTPHREAMRQRIADIAGIPVTRVSVKATTMERLGFIGREEGIAAQAVASIRLPETA